MDLALSIWILEIQNQIRKDLVVQMISQSGLKTIDLMIGDNEIDCLEHHMDDFNSLDFCGDCDILHNEI